MSLIELYSIEAEYNEKRKQYISLVDSIKYSCLGENKSSKQCLKAAQLNADMQSCLIRLSNLSIKYPPPEKPIDKHQSQLLNLSDTLEKDMQSLLTNYKSNDDLEIITQMGKQTTLLWGIVMIFIVSMVIYQYKKI